MILRAQDVEHKWPAAAPESYTQLLAFLLTNAAKYFVCCAMTIFAIVCVGWSVYLIASLLAHYGLFG